MMNEIVARVIDEYRNRALAWKLSASGVEEYLILISEEAIKNAFTVSIRVKVKAKDYWLYVGYTNLPIKGILS